MCCPSTRPMFAKSPLRSTRLISPHLGFSEHGVLGQSGRDAHPSGLCDEHQTEIDAHNPESLCGTIAGDDTILAVIREGFERSRVVEELAMILPAVRGRM